MPDADDNFRLRGAAGIAAWAVACVVALAAVVAAAQLDEPLLLVAVGLIGLGVVAGAGASVRRWWRGGGRGRPVLAEAGRWMLLFLSGLAVACAFGFTIAYLVQPATISSGWPGAPRRSSSPVLGMIVGVVAVVVVLCGVAGVARAARPRRAVAAVRYLNWLVQRDLPLVSGLDAAARGEGGRLAVILYELRTLLADGAAVGEALRQAAPELPLHELRRLASAERLGRLKPALHRLAAAAVVTASEEDAAFAVYRYYPAVLAFMVAFITGVMIVFILPKYQSILKDFKVPLPTPTRLLIEFSRGDLVGFVWLALLVAPLVWLGRAIAPPSASRIDLSAPLRWAWDYLVAPLPLIGTAARDRAMVDVCEVLADAVEAGHTLDEGLAEAASIPMSAVVAARVRRWRAAAGGAPPAEAARAAGMPPLLVGMLATAGDRPAEALRFLAQYHAARLAQAEALLRTAYVLAVAVIGGAVVAFLALSMFLPIRTLMDAVNPYPVGM